MTQHEDFAALCDANDERNKPMQLAKQLVDKCQSDGVQFGLRMGYPIEDDAVTVMANACEIFETIMNTRRAADTLLPPDDVVEAMEEIATQAWIDSATNYPADKGLSCAVWASIKAALSTPQFQVWLVSRPSHLVTEANAQNISPIIRNEFARHGVSVPEEFSYKTDDIAILAKKNDLFPEMQIKAGVFCFFLTSTQPSKSASALAETIAGYPKIRLCQSVDGTPHYADYLLSEKDRYAIVQALRASAQAEELEDAICERCGSHRHAESDLREVYLVAKQMAKALEAAEENLEWAGPTNFLVNQITDARNDYLHLLNSLQQSARSVPEGWALVPKIITDKMDDEMTRIGDGPLRSHQEYWAAMLAAAPVPHSAKSARSVPAPRPLRELIAENSERDQQFWIWCDRSGLNQVFDWWQFSREHVSLTDYIDCWAYAILKPPAPDKGG